ncbi:2-hydroxyacid dehydrogenase [Pedobacter cryophilus]|uniref:Glyoxylate/hydroxypyruvate reductase A n=1 Tax=Pedobacter cryophilus TaxID=2571271 RepID=A0A4U1C0C5_9SPHI|nr:glyoxylate/hydroxypyruvate reductase A [Pedobacter cryophilus]TKB98942.1 glyoxylate/hydroxypyruvate reductase A [Pedobacter cryophilus]
MSIAIIFNHKDPKHWATALQAHLPETLVEIYPNIKDKESVEFVLCWKPDADVLANFPNVKVIQSVGAAIDHITKKQEIKENQTVCRIVDENLSHDMFEFLLTTILVQLKNIPLYSQQKEHKLWQPKTYKNIANTHISILGIGEIGADVAKKLAIIGFTVKGWSGSKKDITGVDCYAGAAEMDSCLKNTDVLINLLPATIQTENIINKSLLMKLNKGGFLINVGRGEHLVEQDLMELLNTEHLSGAFLDVFRTEPLPSDHPFWAHPKIQITPHIASITNIESAVLLVVKNYKNLLNGLPLKHTVSLTKGY